MASSGLASRIITSARLPASTVPTSLIEPHHAGRNNCCGLNRFHRRESRLDVQLDFAVQAVAWNRLVRSGDDRNARFMQRADDGEFFRKSFSLMSAKGDGGPTSARYGLQFRRDFDDAGLDAGRRFGGAGGEKFEQCDRRDPRLFCAAPENAIAFCASGEFKSIFAARIGAIQRGWRLREAAAS